MLAAIGLSLPIALGLLFVSMPMAVIVLVMINAGAHRGAASFLLGWVLGISAVVAVTIVIATIANGVVADFGVVERRTNRVGARSVRIGVQAVASASEGRK